MWNFLIEVGIWAALYIAGRLLAPSKPKEKPLTRDNPTLPRTEEGAAIPMVFGACRVDSPVLVYAGDLQTLTVDNSNNGAQYIVYALDMLFVVGLPMGNGTTRGNGMNGPIMRCMWIGDQKVPAAAGLSGIGNNVRQWVFAPNALGGPGAGGGLFGSYQWFGGWTDQDFTNPPTPIGDSMLSKLRSLDATVQPWPITGGVGAGDLPGHRKQMCVSLQQQFGGQNDSGPYRTGTLLPPDSGGGTVEASPLPGSGFVLGESPNVDGIAFEVSTYGDKVFSMVNFGMDFGGDADPMECIYDIFTNQWGKLGLPTSKIDTTSFSACSATLKAEGHGYSAVHYSTEDAAQVIAGILKQIDCTLYEEPTTAKIVAKLIRFDYDPATIPSYGVDDILSVDEYAMGAFRDTINEVRVNYTDRSSQYKPATAIAQSLANAVGNGNRRRPKSVDYKGINNAAIAAKVAARDLNVLSQPLGKIKITLDRIALRLRPGDVFKVTWPEYNLTNVIFRAQRVDLGLLHANKVVVDAVQDAFATTYVGLGQPFGTLNLASPYPIVRRFITEAPRWLAQEAFNSGLVGDPDVAHILPLLEAPQSGTQYLVRTRQYNSTRAFGPLMYGWLVDVPQMDFPSSFVVADVYGREIAPYDTAFGLPIGEVTGDAAVDLAGLGGLAATHDQIANHGLNLICVTRLDGRSEFMAFESSTSLGGGQYMLNNVWRGLLDTPPIDFVGDGTEVGFFVTANMVGRRGWATTKNIHLWCVPRSFYFLGSGDDPEDLYVPPDIGFAPSVGGVASVGGRGLLPLPVADFGVAGRRCSGVLGVGGVANRYKIVTLLDEAIDILGKFRSRTNVKILRGDETDGVAPTAFNVLLYGAVQTGNDFNTSDLSKNLTAYFGDTDAVTVAATDALYQCVQIDGYGSIDVVDAQFDGAIQATDPRVGKGGIVAGTFLYGWQVPAVTCFAPAWRNLAPNCDWINQWSSPSEAQGWTTAFGVTGSVSMTQGTFSIYNTATGWYMRPNSATFQRGFQAIISKWKPRGLTAAFSVYIKNASTDANDTGQLLLDYRTSTGLPNGTSTGTATVGGNTTWSKITLSATIPASTYKIFASLKAVEVAVGGTANADTCFAEPELRIGEFGTTNGLTNGSFETGTTGSWTNDTNSFVVATAIAEPSANYAQGGAFATSQIHQDFTLPAGHIYGDTAFVTLFMGSTLANDTGKCTVQALDVSNTVLASSNTGALSFATLNAWNKKTVFVALPDGTTKVRVVLNATRTLGAGNSGAVFDEVTLWVVKDLAPRQSKTFDFSSPVYQAAPEDWQQFALCYSGPTLANPTAIQVPVPTVVMGGSLSWNGQQMHWTDDGVYPDAKVTGYFVDRSGVKSFSVIGWQFARASGAGALHIAATADARAVLGNFKLTDAFTVRVDYRVDEPGFATACGLVGRMDLSAGWGLNITAGGQLQATLRGVGSTSKSVATGRVCTEGGYRIGFIVNDPVTQLLWVYDETGGVSVSTATGLGAIDRIADTCHLRIGRDADDHDVLPGQIARVMTWPNVVLSATEISQQCTMHDDPTGAITTYTRTAAAAMSLGTDGSGDVVAIVPPNQVAVGKRSSLTLDGGTGYALLVGRSCTNKIQSFDFAGASWVKDASTTLTQSVVDMTGRPRGVTVAGDATNGFKTIGVTVGAVPSTIAMAFWARASTGTPTLNVELRDSADNVIQTIGVTLSTLWQRFDLLFSWSGVTATCRFRFVSAAGSLTFDLGGIVFCGLTDATSSVRPGLVPCVANSTHGDHNAQIVFAGLGQQFNAEGEIIAVGAGWADNPSVTAAATIVRVGNGANAKNRRELQYLSTNKFRLAHNDGAASPATVNSDISYTTVGSHVWTVHGRWNMNGMLDNIVPQSFAEVAYTDNAQATPQLGGAGRTATWTNDTTNSTQINIGSGTGVPDDLAIRSITVQAREAKFD